MNERDEWIGRFLDEEGEAGDVAAFLARHPDAPHDLAGALARVQQLDAAFPRAERLPAALGGWQLCEELGRGGAARVWRAESARHPGVRAALKRLDPLLAVDPRAVARFHREAELLQSLAHPHLARLLDRGVDDAGVPWLVLELCDGGSLAAWLAARRAALAVDPTAPPRAPMPEWRVPGEEAGAAGATAVARFTAALADALAALHGAGVIHRDVKPGNVLLRADGTPVLIDLGLATRVDRSTLSATGDVLGTLPTMAPEQAQGRRVTAACDLFGLGALLHELLTLVPPRQGSDAAVLLHAARRIPIARLPPPSASDVERAGAASCRALLAITERALAFRPQRRFASAAALRDALCTLAEGGVPPIAAPSTFERSVDRLLVRRAAVAVLALTAAVGAGAAWQLARPDQAARVQLVRAEQAAARDAFARAWLAAQGDEVALGHAPGPRARAPLADPEGELSGALAAAEALRRDGELRDAIAALRPLTTAAPDDPLAQALLAVATLQAGDGEAALRELEEAWRLLPEAQGLARPLAELAGRDGRAKFAAGELAGAAERFEQQVALRPRDDEAWRQLAIVRARLGDAAGARAAVDQALALPLDRAELAAALRTDAVALDAAGMRPAGIAVLRGVVERSPRYVMGRLSLGLLLDRECDLAGAREQYDAALLLEPERPETLLALTYLHAGSNRAQCAKCVAAFEAHPELYAPDRVEELAIRWLRATRGADSALPGIVAWAKSVGRGGALRPVLDELIAAAPDDRVLGALTRARRGLTE